MKIAFDTNVLIYFFEGIEPQATKVEKILGAIMKGQTEGVISTITVAEVLTGFYIGTDIKVARAKKTVKGFTLNDFKIVPVTFEIADLALTCGQKGAENCLMP